MADEETQGSEAPSSTVDTESTTHKSTQKGKIATQILGASICMLGGFTLGQCIGWSSPAGAINTHYNETKKGSDKDSVQINEQMHWVGSLFNVGAMLVMFPIGSMLKCAGCKVTMLIVAPLVSCCFLILAFVFKMPAWIVARIFMGFFAAAFCVAAPIYVGEIAEARIRGALGVCFQLLLVIGIMLEFCLGKSNDIRILGAVSAAFPIIFVILFIFVPETPKFLIMKGKIESAKKSLQWYRGKQYDITDELNIMTETVRESQETKTTFKDLFGTKASRKSLVMSLILMIAQQLSGINILMFYAAKIFADSGSSLSDIDSSIILAGVQIVGTVVSTLIIDKVGRKILLYTSHGGMGVFLVAMGGWQIFLAKNEKRAKEIGYIPIIIMCLYLIFFSLGSGPIPWAIVGEIFPHNLKTYSGAIGGFVNWGFAFLVTVSYRALKIEDPTLISVVYFVYAGLCFISLVFFFFFVIETRGKTLEEIQEELSR